VTSLTDKAGFLIVANLVKYAVGFVLPMVLVRMLSQSDYGTYQQMILISTAAIGVMSLGLPTSVYYFYHHVPPARIPALMAQTLLMLGVAGSIATLAIVIAALPIAKSMNNAPMAGLLQIYAVSIVFMIASEYSIHFMISQDRYWLAVGFEIGEIFVRVLMLLAPLWLGYGFEGLIAGIVIFAVLRFVVRTGYLFYGSGMQFAGWSNSLFPLEQLGYSVPLALVTLVWLIAGTFNKAILAGSFTPEEFAIYSVGTLEIPLDTIFQVSVANVLRASLPPLIRDGNLAEVVRVMREAMRKLSIIMLPSFVFLFGHSEQFITLLFTTRYAESVHVFRIYLLLMPLYMLILSPIPQVFGRTRVNLYINLIAAALLLVVSYPMLKIIGFYGPAIAVVGTQYFSAIIFILVVLRFTRTTPLRLFPMLSLLRVVAASLAGLLIAQLAHDVTSSGLLNLALAGVIFSVGFLAVAALIGVLEPTDYQLVRRWVGSVLPTRKS